MLEQGYYIFLLVVMILMMLMPNRESNSTLKNTLLFLLLLGLSAIVRLHPHNDIPVYIESFSLPISSMMSDPYYLKNILFWIPSAFLHQHVFNSEYIVLLLWDCITFILLLKICNRLKMPSSSVLVYLISFMGLLTLQNIYRQYIATIIVLYALTFPRSKAIFAYGTFLISILIHSSLVLFAPVLYLYRRKKALHPILFIGLLVGTIALLPFVLEKDFSYNTGLNMNKFYLVLVLSISIFIWQLIRILESRMRDPHTLLQSVGYLSVLAVVCFLKMDPSLYYERIALIELQILAVFLFQCLSRLDFPWSSWSRLAAALVLILPIFFFESTRAMLQNAPWLNN